MQINSTLSVRRCLLLLPILLAPIAAAAPAYAQDIAAAEVLYNRGLAEMEAGAYEAGCTDIGESQRLDPRLGTLFTLATCERRWGHIATAFTRFGDYLTLYGRLTPELQARQGERANEATKQREELAPQIPSLTLTLAEGAPPRSVVTRNGVAVVETALGVALPVDPGTYTITTQAPGGPMSEQTVTIEKGEKKALTLEVKPAPLAVKVPPGPKANQDADAEARKAAQRSSGRRAATYVAGGVGLLGLTLGGVMGGLAMAKRETIKGHCGSAIHSADDTACDPAGLDAASSAKSMALVSTIGFGVGVAGIGTAAVLLLTGPSKPAAAGAKKGWMTAGVLDAGPAGAVLGVRGAW